MINDHWPHALSTRRATSRLDDVVRKERKKVSIKDEFTPHYMQSYDDVTHPPCSLLPVLDWIGLDWMRRAGACGKPYQTLVREPYLRRNTNATHQLSNEDVLVRNKRRKVLNSRTLTYSASEMDPVIENSIIKLSESQWLIGSSMICETNSSMLLNDVLASWIGDDGKTFYLRKSLHSSRSTAEDISELSHVDRVHKAGTGAAVWAFGGVHIKVKAWIPELQLEWDTIEHVRKTGIPVPKVVCSWIDTEWNRTFLILKSIKGKTLYEAWPVLSQSQKSTIADRIASYCAELAFSRSCRMETLGGRGVREDWLTKNPSLLEPSWKPFVQGPFTVDSLQSYIGDTSINTGSHFLFYHADLGPTNIILGDDGNVIAVIDWESAAFYPRFWIATKPLFSAGFNLAGSERSAWAFFLSRALERKGFKADVDLYKIWRAAVKN